MIVILQVPVLLLLALCHQQFEGIRQTIRDLT
jgi:hypothetical protein